MYQTGVIWLLLISSINLVSAADLDSAMRAEQSGDYQQAVSIYESLIDQDDDVAMARLAAMHQRGDGMPQDLDQAVVLYERAAARGNADAQYNLGNLYLLGEGVAQDDDWALTYYRRAAEQGHRLAARNMAQFYKAAGIQRPSDANVESAESIVDEPIGEDQDSGEFEFLAIDDNYNDEANTPDDNESSSQVDSSQVDDAEGESAATKFVGFFKNLFGKDKTDSAVEALDRDLSPKSDQTSAVQQPESEILDEQFSISEIEAEIRTSQTFSETPATNNPSIDNSVVEPPQPLAPVIDDREERLALVREALLRGDDSEAVLVLESLAAQGDTKAQYLLSELYLVGDRITKDEPAGLTWLKRAAEGGHSQSQFELAERYMRGQGMKADDAMAITLYRRAARAGHHEAREKVTAIYRDAGLPLPDLASPPQQIAVVKPLQKHSQAIVTPSEEATLVATGERTSDLDLVVYDVDEATPKNIVEANDVYPIDSNKVETTEEMAAERPPMPARVSKPDSVVELGGGPTEGIGAVKRDHSKSGQVRRRYADSGQSDSDDVIRARMARRKGNDEGVLAPTSESESHVEERAATGVTDEPKQDGWMTKVKSMFAADDTEYEVLAAADKERNPKREEKLNTDTGLNPQKVEVAEWQKNVSRVLEKPTGAEEGKRRDAPARSQPLADDTMQDAKEALAASDHTRAANILRGLAKDGDAEAQAHLGYMYYSGEGLAQDLEKAIHWYKRAAVQGNRDAQYNLAVAYAFGEGVKQDDGEALIWYRRAAEQGSAIAQYSLGVSYALGEGVAQSDEASARWYRAAAEQGYAAAQYNLAYCYRAGKGVLQDDATALRWFEVAAENGHASAQYSLGYMYRSGKGVQRNVDEAIRWYQRAAEQGHSDARADLASLQP